MTEKQYQKVLGAAANATPKQCQVKGFCNKKKIEKNKNPRQKPPNIKFLRNHLSPNKTMTDERETDRILSPSSNARLRNTHF